jgi:hypothetical protein
MMDTVLDKPVFHGASTGGPVSRLILQGIRAASSGELCRRRQTNETFSHYEDANDFEQHRYVLREGNGDGEDIALPENDREAWTEAKNQRRCDLIDRKYMGRLTPSETLELDQLQAEMLRYRQRAAPLPLEDARRLHHELLTRANPSPAPTDL